MNAGLRLGIAAIASGGAVALAFPSADVGALAWVALVPLLSALRSASVGRAWLAGMLFGGAAGIGIFGWLFAVPGFGFAHFALLAVYTSLYPAAWCAAAAVLMSPRRSVLPALVGLAALWVALDLLRGHAGFLALPWATLGQSQHANLAVLQVAALGGESAVTFLVVLANVAISTLIASLTAGRSPRPVFAPCAALATVAAAHVGGAIALALPESEPTLTVAAVQPAIGLAERDSPAGRAAIWRRLEALTHEAAASPRHRAAAAMPSGHAALIVWPETAVGDPRHQAALADRLAALSRSVGVPIVVGAAETEKFAAAMNGVDAGALVTTERDAYNSAYLVVDGGIAGEPYRKRVLMPFGEYLPLRGDFAWPDGLVPAVVDGQAGDRDAGFEIATAAGPVAIAATICWESEFAALTRGAVAAGARVAVQLTNDAWFGASRAAAQHNLASVMRAVENRVPVVLASNTGPSQVIDGHGRVLARVDGHGGQGVAVATVALGRVGGSVYTRIGDAFAFACIAVVLIVAAAGFRSRPRAARSPSRPTLAKEAT